MEKKTNKAEIWGEVLDGEAQTICTVEATQEYEGKITKTIFG